MAVQNTLPSPGNPIDEYGDNAGSITGPGFASVSLESVQPVVTNRSNSGIAFINISDRTKTLNEMPTVALPCFIFL